MKATLEIEATILLELTEKEALILKELIQNPLSDDEPKDHYRFRSSLWSTLTSALDK